nr:DarT ssDNA thymidine ADP-ribosyltransferase family protein [uncultured Campylobacter sp.]
MAIYQVDNTINQIPLKNGYVYCISSIHNIKSILEHGFRTPKKLQTQFAQLINNKPLDEYICFYFNPRNSLLYSRQKTYGDDIVILEIKKDVLLLNNVIFTNKSVKASNFCFADEIKDLLNPNFINWDEVFATSWSDANENVKNEKKFKMMAEVLVPDMVPSAMIAGIVCQNSSVCQKVARILNNSINISWNSSLFFNDSSDTTANQKRELKYHPQTKDELLALVDNEDIYLGDIDTSAITDMSDLFMKIIWDYDASNYCQVYNCRDFRGIELWDVSNVTDMSGMFEGCNSFNQPLDSWNVSNVTNMSGMFSGCENFNQPLNSWNVSNVTDMSSMFSGCGNFNQPLNSWNVSNVTNMRGMFWSCKKFNQPLNSWDVSNVTDMSSMFSGCGNFNQPLDSWDVSNVTNMSGMFEGCNSFNQPLDSWDVSNVTDMHQMFYCCYIFNQPLNTWNVKNVINMSWMFGEQGSYKVIGMAYNQPLDSWDVSSVVNMSCMFYNCINFNQSLNSWNVSNVTDMSGMFFNCKNFNQSLKNWNVGKVINIDQIFNNYSTLTPYLSEILRFDMPVNVKEIFSRCGIDKNNLPEFVEEKEKKFKKMGYDVDKDDISF